MIPHLFSAGAPPVRLGLIRDKEMIMSSVVREGPPGFPRGLFSPDPLSRFQYENAHGVKERPAAQQAMRSLMLAVLENGLACYQSYLFQPSATNEALSREAEEWIASENDEVFSFNNICETLGLDPKKMRIGLRQWKAKQMRLPLRERRPLVTNKGKSQVKRRKVA